MRYKLKSILLLPKPIFLGIFILIVSLLTISSIVKAVSLSPSGSPASTMYNLSDIYTRLTTNTTNTEGNHNLSSSASPSSTMHTLKEIYEAIPTIAANTVKLGTTYMGITGTLTPEGGTATVGDIFNGKTDYVTNDWNLDTGTLNLACNTATFNGTGNKVSDSYDGEGNGNNRWCMTDSGTATASDILLGKIAWVNGLPVTGNFSPSLGYTYGDNNAANVLTLAAGAGTYNVTNLIVGNVKSGITFGVSSTGTLTPEGGNATVSDLFSGKTANLTNDWVPDTGTLNLACNTGTFDGTANKVNDAYDGSGNGNNRWCMSDSGNATASDIVSGKVAWVNGLPVTGNFTLFAYGDSSASKVLTTATGAGTYNATNLTASTVKSGTAFGVGQTGAMYGDTDQSKVLGTASAAGTALKDLFNGSNTAGNIAGGSQIDGGVDDCNYSGTVCTTAPSNRYGKNWTVCAVGNHYCGTNDTGAAYRDESTGLVWSKTMNNSTYALDGSSGSNGIITWFAANNCVETSGSVCTKNTSLKTGCEASTGWNLPTQRQLLQAYIDGYYGNLDAGVSRSYWSNTTVSSNNANAWYITLSNAYTNYGAKTATEYIRCVQFSLGN
jgi:hypothetical protein